MARTRIAPILVTAMVAVLLALMPGVAVAAPGDLDPTFGTEGKVLTDFAGASDQAEALVLQPDGKLVAAGSAWSATSESDDFALARYLGDDAAPPPPGNHTLTVTREGAGRGKVTSSPAGINCGSDCTEAYAAGTEVTLSARAARDSTFAGWSGDCSGTASTCTVTMDQARSVTATFTSGSEPPPPTEGHTLTVTLSGTGRGRVTSSPAGITCGTDCSETYAAGTLVTLTAQAASGSVFAGWSGACSGTATTCTLTMDAAKSVTATFS